MSEKTFYITTPIYYPSGKLHIGNTYTTVAADTMARYKRLQGYHVYFLTGTDEHGQKIARKALEAQKTPQEYVDEQVAWIKSLWHRYNISYDQFIRTTDKDHIQGVQMIFNQLKAKGDIYKDKYAGWYCVPCESFLLERQLKDGNCPDCDRKVEWTEEESYFFKLSKYGTTLLEYINQNPDFIQPDTRRNEMINFINNGLEDLCISRTSIEWGVPIPDAPGHVAYVWIDALSNYITALGYPQNEKFKKYWPADIHLVGKEIVRFHTIIWPIMLLALNLPLPKQVFGHGWLILDNVKMSKSLGNVIDPFILADEFGVDAIRYYLLREVVFGADGNYSVEALIKRSNYDLANDLGNLLHRTISMVEKYFKGIIPQPQKIVVVDQSLQKDAQACVRGVEENLDKLHFHTALEELWQFIRRSNKYIDETTPWILGRENDTERLSTVLYNLLEALRFSALMLRPFLPEISGEIAKRLSITEDINKILWQDSFKWGSLTFGNTVFKGDPIFPRLDLDDYQGWGLSQQEKAGSEKVESVAQKQEISFEDFKALDLIVVEIIAVEKIKKSKKLLKIIVDTGETKKQVVAGLAPYYQAAELLGKKVVFLNNLQKAKLFNVESEGMILASGDDQKMEVLESSMPKGSVIS